MDCFQDEEVLLWLKCLFFNYENLSLILSTYFNKKRQIKSQMCWCKSGYAHHYIQP